MPRSIITYCINCWKKTGTGTIKACTGSPLKLSERDQRTAACSFREELLLPFVAHNQKSKAVRINIHPQTLIKYTAINGFGSYSLAYVPKLTLYHMKRRLDWGKNKVEWTPHQWKNVIWSDLSKFNVEGSDGRVCVTKKEEEKYTRTMSKRL